MTKIELLTKVREVLSDHCDDPADEIIRHGEALVAIGKALKGTTLGEARSILTAVRSLECGNG